MNKSNRRNFIKAGAGVAGALFFSNSISKAFAAACGITPPQTTGPFYPGEKEFHADNDLTRIAGHEEQAQGQLIYIEGKVLDQRCNPVAGANVEIWQACATGKYNNPKDDNPAALDPDFKYWGEATTAEDGSYLFITIIPGAYPADVDWTRPPHVHFKVSKLGFKELITQMYFKGNPLNEKDLILRQIPKSEQESVIVEFSKPSANFKYPAGSLVGTFNITLISVRVSDM